MNVPLNIPLDHSRQITTHLQPSYLLQIPVTARIGSRVWVRHALVMRVVEGRKDVSLLNRIWMERHYLGVQPTPPKVKRLSYLADLQDVPPGPAGAALAFTCALQPSNSRVLRSLCMGLDLHPCSVIELVRCWRADDLSPELVPDLLPYALRRLIKGGNGVASLATEWAARKLTGGLMAPPCLLLTYADPAVGHDGGLYLGAGGLSVGTTASGKLAFAWSLTPTYATPLQRFSEAQQQRVKNPTLG